MPLQDVFQPRFIQVGLLKKLFDARLVIRPSHAGGNGHDVFGAEDFGGDALEFDAFGFLGQSAGDKKLHRESAWTPAWSKELRYEIERQTFVSRADSAVDAMESRNSCERLSPRRHAAMASNGATQAGYGPATNPRRPAPTDWFGHGQDESLAEAAAISEEIRCPSDQWTLPPSVGMHAGDWERSDRGQARRSRF